MKEEGRVGKLSCTIASPHLSGGPEDALPCFCSSLWALAQSGLSMGLSVLGTGAVCTEEIG